MKVTLTSRRLAQMPQASGQPARRRPSAGRRRLRRPAPAGSRPAGRRPSGYVVTPGPQATTAVDATRANVRRRGHHLPDRPPLNDGEWFVPEGIRRSVCPARISVVPWRACSASPEIGSGHKAEELDGQVSVPFMDAGPAHNKETCPPVNAARANGGTRGGIGGTCRIVARRLTLTGGTVVWASGCRIAASGYVAHVARLGRCRGRICRIWNSPYADVPPSAPDRICSYTFSRR